MKKTIDAGLMASVKNAFARRSVFDTLAQALAADQPDGSWYKILNAKDDEAEILIYSEIGFWGVNAQQFIEDLREVDAKTINVRINSPGGSVFDGIAIYNALVNHSAKIIVHIDALAASIASVIAMAGDEIRISEVANVMIHKPWSFVVGTDEDMIKEAGVLKNLEDAIVDVYVARTGGDRDEIAKWVSEETWFKGQAAVDAGFADKTEKLVKPAKAAARLPADFLVAIFPNMPADVKAEMAHTRAAPKEIDFDNPRDVEALLRANGASRKKATDIVMKGLKAASREESASEPERTVSDSREESERTAKAIAEMAASVATVAAIFGFGKSLTH